MRRIYIDCDGVLAHFDKHVFELFGQYPSELGDDAMWDLVEATPDFWPTIPVKWGAHDLWRMIQAFEPVVLTGCPKTHYEVAAAHKVEWVKKHFGEDAEIITCLSRNKPMYMRSQGDVLIDDFRSNVKRWSKAGGISVHYRTAEQAKTDLNLAVLNIGDKVQMWHNDAYVFNEPKEVCSIFQDNEENTLVSLDGGKTRAFIRDVIIVERAHEV